MWGVGGAGRRIENEKMQKETIYTWGESYIYGDLHRDETKAT